jgi:hypothetical protein
MPSLKITQAVVERVTWASAVKKWFRDKPPKGGRIELWDSHLAGFGLRLSEGGSTTWQSLYRVNGKLVREKIGTLAQIPSVADARERARESMLKARAGTHPVKDRRHKEEAERRQAEVLEARARNTLGALIDRYLAERPAERERRRMSAEYLLETTRTLTRDVKETPLGSRPLAELGSDEIRRHVRAIAKSRPSQANHVLVYLRAALAGRSTKG